MQLSLSRDEGRLLVRHLDQHIEQLDASLVHTDKRELQRALASELNALRTVTDRIRMRLDREEMPDVV